MKTKKNWIALYMTVLMLFSSLSCGTTVSAAEPEARGGDISQTAVTRLTVLPSSIDDGGNVTVRVEFDETGGNIQSGDTIRITWPSSGEVYLMGYSKTVPLTINGQVVGEAIIATNGATITFNEKVNNLDDVQGWLEFEVQGRNVTNTSEEDTKTVTIQSGSKSADVSIRKPQSGTTGVFYYKTGDMLPEDTEHVRWFLAINNEKAHSLKEVRIEDSIQPGQRLLPESFEITVEGTHPNTFSGAGAISDFENAYPGATISCNVPENRITIKIPQGYASLNKILIMYRTEITDTNQQYFVNNTKAWYQEDGQEAVEGEDFNHSVKNINAGGGISGTVKGELKILKVTKDSKIPVPNVAFRLVREDGGVIKEGLTELTLNTDNHGIATVKGLPVGKYLVKEINAPNWIEFDPLLAETISFEVKDTDSEGTLLNIDYAIKTISIPVVKQWIGKASDVVNINLIADGAEVQEITLNAENQWKHTFTNLPKYNPATGNEIVYTLSEDSIIGYSTVIAGDSQNGFTVTNTEVAPNIGNLMVSKTVSGGGSTDKKFTFTLSLEGVSINGKYGDMTFENGTAVFKMKHGENKVAVGLPAGVQYVITEGDNSGYTVTVNGGSEATALGTIQANTTVTAAFNNHKPSGGGGDSDPSPAKVVITAHKTLDGGSPPNHFTFQMKDSSGKVIQTKNNNGNTVTFDTLVFSKTGIYTYYLSEQIGTDNNIIYDTASYTIKIEVTKSGDYQAVVFYEKDGQAYHGVPAFSNKTKSNGNDTVSIQVNKTWADDNNKENHRPGSVQVQLYKDGAAYGDAVTLSNLNGWGHSWNGLSKIHTWTVDELNVPEGYTKTVSQNGMNFTITNTKTASTPNTPNKPHKPGTPKQLDNVPKTGDTTHLDIWSALLILSILGMGTTLLIKRKKHGSFRY